MAYIKIRAFENECMNCRGNISLDDSPVVYGTVDSRIVFGQDTAEFQDGDVIVEFVEADEFGFCNQDCADAFENRIAAVLENPELIDDEDEPRTWEVVK